MSIQDIDTVLAEVATIVEGGNIKWYQAALDTTDPKGVGFTGTNAGWKVVVARFTPPCGPHDVGYDGAAACIDGQRPGTLLHLTRELAEKAWLQANEATNKSDTKVS